MNTTDPRFELIRRCRDGEASPDELALLESNLRYDAAFRDAYVRYINVDVALSSVAEAEPLPEPTPVIRPRRWIQWRPLIAAAAGLVIGLFSASMVFAYGVPRAVATASRLFVLVDGSFEDQTGRLASGFPAEFGKWSGDEAKFAREKAVDGKQALRFVRAEGDATVANSPANSCDVYQLVDLRSLKADAEGGEATLEMSAQFLDARIATGANVTFTCRLYVFSGSPESLRGEWPLTRKDAMAYGAGIVESTGGAPQTWRSVTTKVLLPAQADFAVVQLVAGKVPLNDNQPAEFSEQFVDDVQLTLKTQPTLPVRFAQR
ncbi:MAG: hypothetical protein RL693_2233 [Verrucomicrobiota bacterium]|jgi:hypothetical protein